MIRSFYATLVIICLGCGLRASSQPEEPTAKAWVPFVAKSVQTYEYEGLQRTGTVSTSGIYVRDKRGSWFRRVTTNSVHGDLHLLEQVDTATLCDRANHRAYFLDFTRKTIKPVQVGDRDQPLSPRDFEFQHSLDKFLGRQIISGVECEGYAIHGSRHEGKYVTEAWYAPSLNYLIVESKSRNQAGQKVATRAEEIQVGKEPDPQYFSLPEGFKRIE